MKPKWQLPIKIGFWKSGRTIWLSLELRHWRYIPIPPEWDSYDISGILRSYDD